MVKNRFDPGCRSGKGWGLHLQGQGRSQSRVLPRNGHRKKCGGKDGLDRGVDGLRVGRMILRIDMGWSWKAADGHAERKKRWARSTGVDR